VFKQYFRQGTSDGCYLGCDLNCSKVVNKQIPTFEDKAEALHYFPMWRTWFGLNGLCISRYLLPSQPRP
jgi:hypothetical protein